MDVRLADLIARQHTMVSLGQLRQLGLSASAVRSRVAGGRLHPVHRGVYSLIPGPWPYRARCAAGVLVGERLMASHRSASDLLGLVPARSPRVEVTALAGRPRSRPGLRVHRAAWLHAADQTAVEGIPCTSVARTLLDLAATEPTRTVERAIEQAEKLRVLDLAAVDAARERAAGHRGHRVLGQVLAAYREPPGTRLELERRFLELIVQAGLRRPEVNVWLPDVAQEVDAVWRAERVVVELDSRAHHLTTRAMQRDRRRDRDCHRHGWLPLRYTWWDLTADPEQLVAELGAFLARSPPPLSG